MHDLLLVELFDAEYYRDLEMWVRLKVIENKMMGKLQQSN